MCSCNSGKVIWEVLTSKNSPQSDILYGFGELNLAPLEWFCQNNRSALSLCQASRWGHGPAKTIPARALRQTRDWSSPISHCFRRKQKYPVLLSWNESETRNYHLLGLQESKWKNCLWLPSAGTQMCTDSGLQRHFPVLTNRMHFLPGSTALRVCPCWQLSQSRTTSKHLVWKECRAIVSWNGAFSLKCLWCDELYFWFVKLLLRVFNRCLCLN